MSIFVSLIISLFLAVSPVLAETGPGSYIRPIQERLKEEFKQAQEQKKEEFKIRVEEAREKAKQEIEKKREELKTRLEKIKNENKKRIVERVAQQVDELNERMVKHFSEVLDKLEKTLVNIKSRIDKAKARGLDTASAEALIGSAEDAIAGARAAIEAQSAKTYTPEISGEEMKLKVEVGQARQVLHNDISSVREKVRVAYEAVRNIATALVQIPKVDEDEGESPSPSPTPTL